MHGFLPSGGVGGELVSLGGPSPANRLGDGEPDFYLQTGATAIEPHACMKTHCSHVCAVVLETAGASVENAGRDLAAFAAAVSLRDVPGGGDRTR